MAMKLSTSISKILLSSIFLTSSLYAQDIDFLNNEVKQLEKELKELKEGAEDKKAQLTDKEFQEKQERVAKNIAKATARTEKNIAKSSKSEMFKRVIALQEKRATYLKGLADGKLRPFPTVVANWENYQSRLTDLKADYARYQATESSVDKAKLAAPLLVALQPIAPWLDDAQHSSSTRKSYTKEDVAESERLQKLFNTTRSAGLDGKLKITTPEVYYTLKHLPAIIQFVGAPDSEILLHSEVGGKFPNNLSFISIKTDENGIASTSWISKGEAVASCSILYRSTELPSNRGKINMIVRQLSLQPLEVISPVVKATATKIERLNPIK